MATYVDPQKKYTQPNASRMRVAWEERGGICHGIRFWGFGALPLEGEADYDIFMLSRSAALLLLLFCTGVLSHTSAQSSSHAPKIFRDQALGITYSYPSQFIAENLAAPASAETTAPQCARSTLSAGSTNTMGSTVFVLSNIDNTCPGVLNAATQHLGSFTREQILRQMKQYGTPTITHEPIRYAIDGHPAAITLASAEPDEAQAGKTPKTTYAAKACWLREVPVKGGKSSSATATQHVLCFDFTTQQQNLLLSMLAFTVQFEERPTQSLVPGSVLR